MTPAELKGGSRRCGSSSSNSSTASASRTGELLDALDHSNAELSQALDGELTRLLAPGERVFVDDEEAGQGRLVERRVVDRRKKKPAAKKKAKPAYQDPALLERAWALPVAKTFPRPVLNFSRRPLFGTGGGHPLPSAVTSSRRTWSSCST